MSGMMRKIIDPMGTLIHKTTGNESFLLFGPEADKGVQKTAGPTAAEQRTEAAKKDKLARYKKMQANKTIMTTELEDFK